MTMWGATSGHMRVGVDVSMSPSTVTSSTTQVTLTWTVTTQSVQWYFAGNQTATLSGAVNAVKDYRKADPAKTGTYSTVVGSWTSTVATSSSAPITRQLNVAISGVYTGGSPRVSATFTVPQRPAAPKPASTTPAPVTPAAPTTAQLSKYQVIVASAPVRSQADTSATVVASMELGTIVSGTIEGSWLRYTFASGNLYLPASAVKLVAQGDTATTPQAPAPVTFPAEPASAGSMDLVPSAGVMLWGSGDYDAFPQTAAHGDVVLTAWRHANNHAVDRNASVMMTISRDAGRTYATPWTVPTATVSNTGVSVGGLAWDAKRSQWVMVVIWAQFKSATDNAVISRWTEVCTSADDGATWSTPKRLPVAGSGWFFASDLAVSDGAWVVGGYGPLTGSSSAACLTTISTDAGATWTPCVAVTGVPSGSQWAEPNLAKLPSGAWFMTMRRTDAVELHSAFSVDDGKSWHYLGLIASGFTGNPDVICLPDGTLIVLARTPNDVWDQSPGYALGMWAWGYSLDGGVTWTMRTDFADTTRRNVYGSMASTTSGVALVYASEDDPDDPWGTASVWFSRFVTQELIVKRGFVGAVSATDVSTADRLPVTRVWTDSWTGEELTDKVRWRSLDGFTARDFEVQQGQTVTYRAGNRVTGRVTAPILPHIILVHPLYPDLSLPIEVSTDSARTYSLASQVTEIPASPYAIVTKSGGRKVRSPYGETKFRTKWLDDKEKVLRLFEDGSPLFVSHHPGADFPDWIQPLDDFSEERVEQTCGHPDHGSPLGEWRDWSFKWVAVRRPSAAALPVRRRIRELTEQIQLIGTPIEEL